MDCFSQKIGNAPPTAWEIPLSIVVADRMAVLEQKRAN